MLIPVKYLLAVSSPLPISRIDTSIGDRTADDSSSFIAPSQPVFSHRPFASVARISTTDCDESSTKGQTIFGESTVDLMLAETQKMDDVDANETVTDQRKIDVMSKNDAHLMMPETQNPTDDVTEADKKLFNEETQKMDFETVAVDGKIPSRSGKIGVFTVRNAANILDFETQKVDFETAEVDGKASSRSGIKGVKAANIFELETQKLISDEMETNHGMVSENQILEETKKDLLAEALEAEVEKDERAAKESDVLNQVVEMASTEGRKEVEEEEIVPVRAMTCGFAEDKDFDDDIDFEGEKKPAQVVTTEETRQECKNVPRQVPITEAATQPMSESDQQEGDGDNDENDRSDCSEDLLAEINSDYVDIDLEESGEVSLTSKVERDEEYKEEYGDATQLYATEPAEDLEVSHDEGQVNVGLNPWAN